jgi:TolA-binding protein
MIENQAGLTQAREQLRNMEEVVAELLRQSATMHTSQLALQLEAPMDVIEHLRSEIDDYLGIEKARELLSRSHSVTA